MRSALSRNHSTASPSQKAPRKSSSFLSLRREKERGSSPLDHSPLHDHSLYGAVGTPPSSYFDPNYSSSARPVKVKSPRNSLVKEAASPKAQSRAAFATSSGTTPRGNHDADVYAFPTFDSTEDLTPVPYRPAPHQYLRTRSRTGPSGRARWEEQVASVPSLHFSNSSSTQYTETPPRTPVDDTGSTESLEFLRFPVAVSAPIAGVEMMDALVDGMNGGIDAMSMSNTGMSGRSRFGIPNHHPLYQPPLPTPPPGVILGTAQKPRKHRTTRKPSISSSSSDEDVMRANALAARANAKRRRQQRAIERSASYAAVAPIPPPPSPSVRPSPSLSSIPTETIPSRPSSSIEVRKTAVPSISEIIRNHAPPEMQVRTRVRPLSLYTPSHGHGTVVEEPELRPVSSLITAQATESVSRSSIDSVADEVQRTLRVQSTVVPTRRSPPPHPPSAFAKRQSTFSDSISLYSPKSDPGATASLYSCSAASVYQSSHSPVDANFLPMAKLSPQNEVAQYLRSARVTTIVKLTRQPHASPADPLTVSFSDLGSANGHPVIVFLGLGCVRHIMGLYDEMAECLGLRLITIDRWGLGRTDARPKSMRGIIQWASAVEEVLDLLRIDECSVMAHSAGAPYALSFANKVPSRIRGDVCLLAPWVGGSENSGYRWLKYVPNGILRTAQAAEWKLQAWMIGKPPTIAFEGIGFTLPKKEASDESPSSTIRSPSRKPSSTFSTSKGAEIRPHRPSFASSSTFSEYDDLQDFEGKFDSRSTLGASTALATAVGPQVNPSLPAKRKTSLGFLDRLKGHHANRPEDSKPKKLKGLRSMSSLKAKTRKHDSPGSTPAPPPLSLEVGLGLDGVSSRSIDMQTSTPSPSTATPDPSLCSGSGQYPRSIGQRTMSMTSSVRTKPAVSLPSSPSPSTVTTTFAPAANGVSRNFQAALGNALIAASHAESAKGTHNDLLQILNHDNQPWGFSYAAYPHDVRVWYGDRDEKIAEQAVRWMESAMGSDRCLVKVVKSADHGLMYRSSVVVEVLERLLASWKGDREEQDEAFAELQSQY